MKIKNLSLENFKCFKTADIEMGKLTLLTGPNSSGKSSLIDSILCTIQSDKFPMNLALNGIYIDMGSFKEVSYKNNLENIIKINLKFENFDFKTQWKNEKNKNPFLYELEVKNLNYDLSIKNFKDEKYKIIYRRHSQDKDKDVKDLEAAKKFFSMLDNYLEENNKIIKKKKKENNFFKNKDKFNAEFELKDVKAICENKGGFFCSSDIESILNFFKAFEENVNYIGSFRMSPERTYYLTNKSILKIKKQGENHIDQIMEWKNRNSKEYQDLINIMNKLGLLSDISFKDLNGGRFEVMISPHKKKLSQSLCDVGFGISQILPLIVADLQLGIHSTVMVSQPEIHLHPSSQALLGDYYIDQVKNTDKSYIIETHSEYLLNRIRLGIVEGKIKEDDVKIYYLQNNGNESIVNKLEFTKSGEIRNAPSDFFTTYAMDILDITLKA